MCCRAVAEKLPPHLLQIVHLPRANFDKVRVSVNLCVDTALNLSQNRHPKTTWCTPRCLRIDGNHLFLEIIQRADIWVKIGKLKCPAPIRNHSKQLGEARQECQLNPYRVQLHHHIRIRRERLIEPFQQERAEQAQACFQAPTPFHARTLKTFGLNPHANAGKTCIV